MALTNVAVQTVDGANSTSTFVPPKDNTVKFPNLTYYFSTDANEKYFCPTDNDNPGPRDLGNVQFNAHVAGLTDSSTTGPLSPPCPVYDDPLKILASAGWRNDPRLGQYVPLYHCRTERRWQHFALRFFEYNPLDSAGTFPFFTDRVVAASSGPCRRYTYVSDKVDEGIRTYTIKPDASDATTTLTIAEQIESLSGTTYVYDGANIPPDAVDMDRTVCGDRCVWVWAHLSPPLRAPGPNSFFQCPVTVDKVTNGKRETDALPTAHTVPNAMARYAAAAIALSGRPAESPRTLAAVPVLFVRVSRAPFAARSSRRLPPGAATALG